MMLNPAHFLQDRALFLQDEITFAFMDDFMVLPTEHIVGNVYIGLAPAIERHDLMFKMVH